MPLGVTGTYTRGVNDVSGTITGELREKKNADGQSYKYVWGEWRDNNCPQGDLHANECDGTFQTDFLYYPDTREFLAQYQRSYSYSWSNVWGERLSAGDPTGRTTPPPTTPVTDLPLGGNRPPVRDIPLSSDRIRAPGGDAGTNNARRRPSGTTAGSTAPWPAVTTMPMRSSSGAAPPREENGLEGFLDRLLQR